MYIILPNYHNVFPFSGIIINSDLQIKEYMAIKLSMVISSSRNDIQGYFLIPLLYSPREVRKYVGNCCNTLEKWKQPDWHKYYGWKQRDTAKKCWERRNTEELKSY